MRANLSLNMYQSFARNSFHADYSCQARVRDIFARNLFRSSQRTSSVLILE